MSTVTGKSIVADELQIQELFYAIWRAKLLVMLVTLLMFSLGSWYAFKVARVQYEASATFSFEQEGSKNFESGNLMSLGALAGLNFNQENTILTQINGADFLRKIVVKLNLHKDTEFYNPISSERYKWVSQVKSILKYILDIPQEKRVYSEVESIDLTLAKLRQNHLKVDSHPSGGYVVLVTSESGTKAALIANTIVKEFLDLRLRSKIQKSEKSLEYLYSALRDRKAELNKAISNLENFTLERNLLSEKEFKQQAARLGEFRKKIKEIKTQLKSLLSLEQYFSTANNVDPNLTEKLDRLYELTPRLKSFVMGRNNNVSRDITEELNKAKTGIKTEIKRINSTLDATQAGYLKLELKAKKSALDARDLAELQFQSDTNLLIFNTLVEQLGTLEITEGYQQAMGEIYETASPPLHPVSPKKRIIIIFSIALGLILGSLISLIIDGKTAKIWRQSQLRRVMADFPIINCKFSLGLLNPIFFGSKRNVKSISAANTFKFSNLCLKIEQLRTGSNKPTIHLTFAEFGKGKLSNTSLAIADLLVENGNNVAILDFTSRGLLKTNLLKKAFGRKLSNSSDSRLIDGVRLVRCEPGPIKPKIKAVRDELNDKRNSLTKDHDIIITAVDQIKTQSFSLLQISNCDSFVLLAKAGELHYDDIASVKEIWEENKSPCLAVLFFQN